MAESTTTHLTHNKSIDFDQICKQVEYYFSDQNLKKTHTSMILFKMTQMVLFQLNLFSNVTR